MIKFDNLVVVMAKSEEGEEMIPNVVIRFLTGEEGEEKRFEHVLTYEESAGVMKSIKTEIDGLIKLGVKELVKDFEGNIKSLEEEIV